MPSKCVCIICHEPCDCDELLCPRCDIDYGDSITKGNMDEAIRRAKDAKIR